MSFVPHDPYSDDESEPFNPYAVMTVPKLDPETRMKAMEAVRVAMSEWVPPTRWQRFRDYLWMRQYAAKLWVALRFVPLWVMLTGKDPRLVSQKVWRTLGI